MDLTATGVFASFTAATGFDLATEAACFLTAGLAFEALFEVLFEVFLESVWRRVVVIIALSVSHLIRVYRHQTPGGAGRRSRDPKFLIRQNSLPSRTHISKPIELLCQVVATAACRVIGEEPRGMLV